ncbi:MAG: glycosyltransferase [Candidatus Aenigmarchaeota archaeon]|nr:glycosyltransferase [Candidatus Aenigmarchaeota archaeon]
MKILITHELFPPDIAGGGEKLTLKLAKLLQEKSHEVKVVTSGDPNIKEYEEIRTIRVPINRYLMNFSLPTILKEARDFDIIQTSSGNMVFPSWLAAKTLKKPISCHIHHILGSYWKDVRGPIIGSFFEFMERHILTKSFDSIIFQNFNSKEIGLGMGIDEDLTHMIQPGLDWSRFQMKGIQKKPFVLFVGNFDMNKQTIAVKGLRYLLEAAENLDDVNFVIVGGGKDLDKIKPNYPERIKFTGPLFGEDLVKLYNEALIFCYPSLTEGFGISLLESMASGCATVSTIDIGQEGPKIEPKNSEQIKRSIENLLKDRKKAKKIGKKNRKLAKEFTWETFIKNYIEIYKSIQK